MLEINEIVARKCLEVVDAGLTSGLGSPEPGKAPGCQWLFLTEVA